MWFGFFPQENVSSMSIINEENHSSRIKGSKENHPLELPVFYSPPLKPDYSPNLGKTCVSFVVQAHFQEITSLCYLHPQFPFCISFLAMFLIMHLLTYFCVCASIKANDTAFFILSSFPPSCVFL